MSNGEKPHDKPEKMSTADFIQWAFDKIPWERISKVIDDAIDSSFKKDKVEALLEMSITTSSLKWQMIKKLRVADTATGGGIDNYPQGPRREAALHLLQALEKLQELITKSRDALSATIRMRLTNF